MIACLALALGRLVLPDIGAGSLHAGDTRAWGAAAVVDIPATEARLKNHLRALTVEIGERSVRVPGNLTKTAEYIRDFYKGIGIEARLEPYDCQGFEVANVVADIRSGPSPARRILIGAHYDSVAGTVGADDNASAVAVQLETARQIAALRRDKNLGLSVVFVSFALEEPPAYGTRFMGSRVFAGQARRRNEKIDAMLCLEMVGYTCREPGCQSYPFPQPPLPPAHRQDGNPRLPLHGRAGRRPRDIPGAAALKRSLEAAFLSRRAGGGAALFHGSPARKTQGFK